MLLRTVLIITCYLAAVNGQFDGSFWWTNKQLLEKASESRNNKNVDFKGETVEQHSNHSERYVTEEHAEMDCTCMDKCKCRVAFDANNENSAIREIVKNNGG